MMWVLNVILQEESKETLGFAAEDSKGDSVPFGTRLCLQSLVCYTFILLPAAGNGNAPPSKAHFLFRRQGAKGRPVKGRILRRERF